MNDGAIESLFCKAGFSSGHGFRPSHLPGVTLFRFARHEPSCPQQYGSGLVFVLQGYKEGLINGARFRTNSARYSIFTNTYPVHCETFTPNQGPLLGVHIALDLLLIRKLVEVVQRDNPQTRDDTASVRVLASGELDGEIRAELQRLLNILPNRADCDAVGAASLTQLYYAVLKSPEGRVLRALSDADSELAKVSRAIVFIQDNFARKLTLDDITKHLHMGRSTLNRIFRQATGETPIQYLRKIRLIRARNLLAIGGKSVHTAATEVGYRSASHFSRDFSQLFGIAPSRAADLPYASVEGQGGP